MSLRIPGRLDAYFPQYRRAPPAPPLRWARPAGCPALRRLRFGAVRARPGRGAPGGGPVPWARYRSGAARAQPAPCRPAAAPQGPGPGSAGASGRAGASGAGRTGPGAVQRGDGGASRRWTGRKGLQPSSARPPAPALRPHGTAACGETLGSRLPPAHCVLFFSTHSWTPNLAPLRSSGLPRSPEADAGARKAPVVGGYGEPGHGAAGTAGSCLASAPARRPAAAPLATSLPVVHRRSLCFPQKGAPQTDRARGGGARYPVLPHRRASPSATDVQGTPRTRWLGSPR